MPDAPSPGGPAFLARVARLLSAYAPADPREVAFRERMLDLAREVGAVERTHFEPGHFTASAFVLSPSRDAVLLIFHKKLERWLQPGGHVDDVDLDPCETARREVHEEVGLPNLPLAEPGGGVFDIDIHRIPARGSEPAHEHFDLRFLFAAPSLEFTRTAEVADAQWMPIAAIDRTTDDESVLRAIRKLKTAARSG